MKKKLCIITLFFAILCGIAGFLVPPLGLVDSSVLWMISQFLLYSSACLGLDLKFNEKLRNS